MRKNQTYPWRWLKLLHLQNPHFSGDPNSALRGNCVIVKEGEIKNYKYNC